MIVIDVKNLSKKFEILKQNDSHTLRDTFYSYLKNPLRLFYPNKQQDFWALKNINLSIEQGEVIGVIGPNGAGKSTLLKILSRITNPTKGRIVIKGKVASLLEVGTGFNPELSGRENIFFNGAILGMKHAEIKKSFEEIVDFSGIAKFLDTPIKYYSSGMKVRLGFSVAAYLQSDILLIDEVLSVGDFEFRKKCLEKIDTITHESGRTIFFVSHDLKAVQSICPKTILLEGGEIKNFNQTNVVIYEYCNKYLNGSLASEFKYSEDPKRKIQIEEIRILSGGNPSNKINIDESFEIEILYNLKEDISESVVQVNFYNNDFGTILKVLDRDSNVRLYGKRQKGRYVTTFSFPPKIFNQQICNIRISCGLSNKRSFLDAEEYLDIKEDLIINFFAEEDKKKIDYRGGVVLLDIPCITTKI